MFLSRFIMCLMVAGFSLSKVCFGFSNPYHTVYVLNKTPHTFRIGTNVLAPQRQGILERFKVSEDPFLQESFRIKGTVYFKGSKKIACSYDVTSCTLLNSHGKNYETFLLIEKKNNKITCRGVVLEVLPGKSVFPKSPVLSIAKAIERYDSYKNHLLSKAILRSGQR